MADKPGFSAAGRDRPVVFVTFAAGRREKEPLTQVELYEALQAAGAKLPENPEAFRLWLHRARKDGLVQGFRAAIAKDA